MLKIIFKGGVTPRPGRQAFMPYSVEHKRQTKIKITEAARILFNRHGFESVSIDMVMAKVGLTRGGFYNHFSNKESLYKTAVESFLHGRGAEWREAAGVHSTSELDHDAPSASELMVDSYLSGEHLNDLDGQCPMIALPSDIARASKDLQGSYQVLLEAMVGLFEGDLTARTADGSAATSESRDKALAMASLCIGGMVVARSLPESALANEVREAALKTVKSLSQK